jgi:signal transduction histidine kinase
MNVLKNFYIFETIPREQRIPGKTAWWSSVQQGKQVPFALGQGFQLAANVAMLAIAVLIALRTQAPALTIAITETLFLIVGVLLLASRILKQYFLVIGAYLIVIALGIILNLFLPGMWGSVGLYFLFSIMLYRFPPGWSLPLAGICLLALLTTDGTLRLFPLRQPGSVGALAFSLVVAGGLCWLGWTQRTQYLLVVRLHETQEQLKEQMARSEALAAEQERLRIARDIHDVLSHSLAVLSIQVQAARHLMKDPERLAAKLDDMASLIHESMAESRRVVGMLREAPPTPAKEDDLNAGLRSIARTFNERTGVSCHFAEHGTPHPIKPPQRETLCLALRELLTNAHRHGAAQTVWITLEWQEAGIALEVHDDGLGASAAQSETQVDELSNGAGGHHGLQGMRERAGALGGQVEAGPAQTGGFTVRLRLPYAPSGKETVREGR